MEEDELYEEELELILGGIPKNVDKEINIIASSKKSIEEKKKLINEIKHKILTGKVKTDNNGSGKKR